MNSIVEMWYDDLDSFKRAMDFIHSDAGKELVIDGEKFIEMRHGGFWIVKEHVILDKIKK
ncbi:MAG: hypothetical protein GX654_15600 [Desulfatiglans sp.]|nr:hypothetical protein [Desulfatiglans sp.]